MLKELATRLKNGGDKIKMIVISIGGNNFGFGDVVFKCVEAYMEPHIFNPCSATQGGRFLAVPAGIVKGEIESAITNVGNAVVAGGYNVNDFSILVQDYPSPIPPLAAGAGENCRAIAPDLARSAASGGH